jgi:hypothetical protein
MQRPTAVSVFGVLNIAFAAMGVMGMFAGLALLRMNTDSNNPAIRAMEDSPGYRMWIQMSVPLGLLSSIALLVSGIGLLMMKNWSRLLAIIYAIYALVLAMIGIAVTVTCLLIPMLDRAVHQSSAEAAGAIAGAIGAMIGSVFALIYPILLLVFMTRRTVVGAMRTVPQPIAAPM